MFYSPVAWSEDRSPRPGDSSGNRAVVHHAGVFVVDLPEGATIVDGRLIAPNGKAATDRSEGLAPCRHPRRSPGANKLLVVGARPRVDSHRADVGKRNPRRQVLINWQVHYNRSASPRRIGRASASGSTRWPVRTKC